MTKAFAENTDNKKVSALIGAGELDEANRAFSASVVMGAGLSVFSALLVFIFCKYVSWILGARDPAIHQMTMQYIYGYLIGFPFFTMTRVLTPYLQMDGQYNRVTSVSILTAECIRVSCFSIPFHAIVYNFNNYLMAAKRLRFCSLYSFLIECGVLVPIAFLLLRILGYQGAWVSKIANMLILSLIVRIRDDCKPFNVTEYYELIKDDQDKEKEISLAIIMKMAKDVKYTAAFGANNLIVRI